MESNYLILMMKKDSDGKNMEKFIDSDGIERVIALKHIEGKNIYIITNDGEIFIEKENYEKCPKNDETYKKLKHFLKVDSIDVI